MLKYKLLIEGRADAIEKYKKSNFTEKVCIYGRPGSDLHVKHTTEFKVIEPFKVLFESTSDELGAVKLGVDGNCNLEYIGVPAGKKFKVTIEEIEK